uniref:Cyclin-dependent kinase inhibitor 1A n=1 Tax=Ambystoma andersoni TaxID=282260 RepID=A0A873A9L7_9SALA|nr:cyclin-dependent kinase inhibitor 1A [Ambystoma andersoni]
MVNMCSSGGNAPENTCSKKVCRNLFGELDHEQFKVAAQEMMESCLEEAKQKWNFDFQNGVPLNGDFKWEMVGAVECHQPLLRSGTPMHCGTPTPQSVECSKTAEKIAHKCSDAEETLKHEGSDAPEAVTHKNSGALQTMKFVGGSAAEALMQKYSGALETLMDEATNAAEALPQKDSGASETLMPEGNNAAEALTQKDSGALETVTLEGNNAAEAVKWRDGDASEKPKLEGPDAREALDCEDSDPWETLSLEGSNASETVEHKESLRSNDREIMRHTSRRQARALSLSQEAREPIQPLDSKASPTHLKRKQTTIKDFYTAKRRSSQSSSKQSP